MSAEGNTAREPGQSATDLVELATGLQASIVSREAGAGGTIDDLADSPLVSGSVYAMQVQCASAPGGGFGQGCEVGNAAWVASNNYRCAWL